MRIFELDDSLKIKNHLFTPLSRIIEKINFNLIILEQKTFKNSKMYQHEKEIQISFLFHFVLSSAELRKTRFDQSKQMPKG